MPLSRSEVDEWATTYIQAQPVPEGELSYKHPLWWGVDRFMGVTDLAEAEDAWSVILEVLKRTESVEVLGVLAAGPLEELIVCWGTEFIDRIEVEAVANPRFRRLLRVCGRAGTQRYAGRWQR